jgi:hypothetical protein
MQYFVVKNYKTKMGVTSYPEDIAAYKWHQKTPLRSFLLTFLTTSEAGM